MTTDRTAAPEVTFAGIYIIDGAVHILVSLFIVILSTVLY